jgi:hypothetical protein
MMTYSSLEQAIDHIYTLEHLTSWEVYNIASQLETDSIALINDVMYIIDEYELLN